MNLTASMNSVSLEPRSLSMASFVALLTSNGPGVKSFLSAEKDQLFLNMYYGGDGKGTAKDKLFPNRHYGGDGKGTAICKI